MWNKNIIIAAAMCCGLASCSPSDESFRWGETECYNNFLWCTYDPVVMERTLVTDFNADARALLSEPIRMELVDEQTGKKTSENELKVYKNGELCQGGVLLLQPTDERVRVGLEFAPSAAEGAHKYSLVVANANLLDRLGNDEVAGAHHATALQFICQKKDVWNPLALGLTILGCVILGFIILWFLLVKRIVYPTFKCKYIDITPKGTTAVNSLKILGYRKVVFTNRKGNKLNPLAKLFTGEIRYNVSDEWQQPWEVEPYKKGVRIYAKGTWTAMPNRLTGNVATSTLQNTATKAAYNINIRMN